MQSNTDAHISGKTLRVKANSEMHSFFNTRKSINLNSLTPYSIKVSIKIHKKLRVDGKSTGSIPLLSRAGSLVPSCKEREVIFQTAFNHNYQ